MKLRNLDKKDRGKVIQFAIHGMHLDWYLHNKTLLNLYSRYFLYLELNRANQIIAAYEGGDLLGILLAEMYDEQPICTSRLQKVYVKFVDWIQHAFFKGADSYEIANKRMYDELLRRYKPDGELIFLAADPDAKQEGIGTALLNALAERECGKRIFLYTDSGCTWQFYEHRGFERFAQRNVELELSDTVPLECYLYQRVL